MPGLASLRTGLTLALQLAKINIFFELGQLTLGGSKPAR